MTAAYDASAYAGRAARRPAHHDAAARTAPRAEGRRVRRRRRTPLERFLLHAKPWIAFVLGIVLAVCVTNLMARNRTNDYGRELRYATYTVKSGDTMWDIAVDMAALNPEYTDVRQYLSVLQRTNHIYGDYLEAGTDIQIPYYATPTEKMRGGGSLEETIVSTYAKYDIVQYESWVALLTGN